MGIELQTMKEVKSKAESSKRDKETPEECLRTVLTEITSQIPYDGVFERTETVNCGYDCKHFVPKHEREDSDKHMCKGRHDKPVFDYQKRCPYKEIHEHLKIEPTIVQETLDEEEEICVPKKPRKEW